MPPTLDHAGCNLAAASLMADAMFAAAMAKPSEQAQAPAAYAQMQPAMQQPPAEVPAVWADMQPDSSEGYAPGAQSAAEGNRLHGSGQCNPCAWHHKTQGCQLGSACTYCHLCPPGELKRRKKAKVAAMRQGQASQSQSSTVAAAGA